MSDGTSQPANAGNAGPETGALDTNQAAAVLANLLGDDGNIEAKQTPQEPADERKDGQEPPKPAEEGANAEDPPATDEEKFTVNIDGTDVELTKSELINGYKAQKSSTQKFEAAAALRKEADAVAEKARAERQQAALGLQQAQAVLAAQLQEQGRIDWDALLEQDPIEYQKQKHLYDKRQAALMEVHSRGQQLADQERQDQLKRFVESVQSEQQELLAKLPEWKDQAKRTAEEKAIADELISRGFSPERVYGKPNPDGTPNLNAPGITDHKIILLARDAMLYRQMMSKAKAAAQKVSNLPQRTVTPDAAPVTIDKRGQQFQQLKKSGSPRDAVGLMAQFV